MSAQEKPLPPNFVERAKTNDVPVARLIGFEASEVADGHATHTRACSVVFTRVHCYGRSPHVERLPNAPRKS
jgi:hypothetical protein